MVHSAYIVKLGYTEYKACWDVQRRVFELRSKGLLADTLLLTEHNHVYTIGRGGDANHLLDSEDQLRAKGVEVWFNDRGGDVTYHGPGQLVGYPILDLRNHSCDLHRYLRDIEEVVISSLGHFGVTGKRLDGYTGVWVGNEKVCAIGIKSSRWVTMHGFALNVNTDLSFFDRIIPCGIFEHGVTSLQQVVGHEVDIEEVSARLIIEFARIFSVNVCDLVPEQFLAMLERTEHQQHLSAIHEPAPGVIQ